MTLRKARRALISGCKIRSAGPNFHINPIWDAIFGVKSHAFDALSLTHVQGASDSQRVWIAGTWQKATPGPFGSGVVKAELSSSTDTELAQT
ncbi:hypothetical protein HPO_08424 [Hyphomonas polymorpha PS728]|uniref:Uncharacterized protein n=1 Tax=Hyphomonas polymorpha PS728 TaxID=1280954 RepID=A0A062VF20_9PROT|nr:hypothetical protein HPO_08424 [Hyphomonas polymorpha PS728]